MLLIETKGETLTLASEPTNRQFGRRPKEIDLGIQKNIAFVVDTKGIIVWQGAKPKLPKVLKSKIKRKVSLPAGTYMPALVECHTQSIFAGHRQNEFEMRNQGATYQQIAEKGGGIRSTVGATRKAISKELKSNLTTRIETFVRQGVGLLECKTGYGLSWQHERRLLDVVMAAAKQAKIDIVTTYLGPHAVGPEFDTVDSYFADIMKRLSSELTKLKVRRADIFIEDGYFTVEQGRRYGELLKKLGIGLTIHADQLSRTGACRLGAELGANSVDHCVRANDEDIKAVAKSETIAVFLPTADFYIKIPFPPARKFIDEGALVALATDFNPGSSPTQDLSFVGVLARLEMKMSLPEVVFSYTLNAARALGSGDLHGSLQPGKYFNLIRLDCDWTDLFYQVGRHPVIEMWARGRRVWS